MSTAILRRALPPRAAARTVSAEAFSSSSAAASSSNPDEEDAVSTAISLLTHKRSKTRWSGLRSLFPDGFTPPQITQILLKISHKAELAYRFFNFAKRHSLSSPLPLHCYAPIIHIVARAHLKARARAQTLIKEAVWTSELVGSDDHDGMPAKVAKMPKLFKELVETYTVCKSIPLVFDLLIEGLLDVNKLDPSFEIVRLLMSRGFCPHIKTCNVLIFAAWKQRGCDFGYDLYREIFGFNDDAGDYKNVKGRGNHKLNPNVHTINALMAGFLREGSVDMVEELWIEMAKLNLTPKVCSYGILMAAYCGEGSMEKARNVWEDLREKGLRPDVGAYNILIGGYCGMGEIEKAEELYREMGLDGLNGNGATYEHLLNGYCLRGDADSAFLVYKDMFVKGFNPCDSTLNTMVRLLCDKKSVLEAFDLFKTLMRNADFQATESSFRILIKGLCSEGKMDEALQLQAQMVVKGFKPDSHLYGAFIDGYIKLGKPDVADRLQEEMVATQT